MPKKSVKHSSKTQNTTSNGVYIHGHIHARVRLAQIGDIAVFNNAGIGPQHVYGHSPSELGMPEDFVPMDHVRFLGVVRVVKYHFYDEYHTRLKAITIRIQLTEVLQALFFERMCQWIESFVPWRDVFNSYLNKDRRFLDWEVRVPLLTVSGKPLVSESKDGTGIETHPVFSANGQPPSRHFGSGVLPTSWSEKWRALLGS